MRIAPTNPSRWLILIVVIIGSFLSFLDIIIINIVMPSIADYFKDGIDKSEWLITGYSLSLAIMFLCSGWLARKYGYKRIYIIGVVIFTLASFLCIIAPTMNFLIAMRILQGVGGGIIIPLSMSIIADNFEGNKRGLALGLLIMVAGMAVSIGPLLGGYFVEIDKWDWIFKINIPIGILLTIIAQLILKNHKDETTPKFDYIGFILVLIWAPLSLYVLSSNSEWSLVLIGVVAFGLFVLRMIYARNPLIDISIFRKRDFVLAFIVMFCVGAVIQGGNYIMTNYLLYGLHYSAYKVGLLLIPLGIVQGIVAPISGYMTHRYGNRPFILLGLVVILIYLYLSSHFAADTPHWYLLLTIYLRGLGIGLSFTALTNLSFTGMNTTEIGSASGVINTIKQLSGSFSIAIVTMLLINNSNHSSGINKYIGATDSIFLLLSGLVVIAIVAVLLIRNKPIKVSEETKKTKLKTILKL